MEEQDWTDGMMDYDDMMDDDISFDDALFPPDGYPYDDDQFDDDDRGMLTAIDGEEVDDDFTGYFIAIDPCNDYGEPELRLIPKDEVITIGLVLQYLKALGDALHGHHDNAFDFISSLAKAFPLVYPRKMVTMRMTKTGPMLSFDWSNAPIGTRLEKYSINRHEFTLYEKNSDGLYEPVYIEVIDGDRHEVPSNSKWHTGDEINRIMQDCLDHYDDYDHDQWNIIDVPVFVAIDDVRIDYDGRPVDTTLLGSLSSDALTGVLSDASSNGDLMYRTSGTGKPVTHDARMGDMTANEWFESMRRSVNARDFIRYAKVKWMNTHRKDYVGLFDELNALNALATPNE